jgi:hypothetical protein
MIQVISRKETEIQDSIRRILNQSPREVRERIENANILITDEQRFFELFPNGSMDEFAYRILVRGFSESFGAAKANTPFERVNYSLIVLNFAVIDAQITCPEQLDGVLAHELGHIFNPPPSLPQPSIIRGDHIDVVNLAKAEASKRKEFYADYFSKLTRTSGGLISCIEDYLRQENVPNRELFEERLQKLYSEEVFIG